MRRLTTCILLALAAGPAVADGGFVPHGPPRALARDIQEPTQKALLYFANGVEDLTLQVRYSGGLGQFVWLVPTPSRPRVDQASASLFEDLGLFTEPHGRQEQRQPSYGGGFGGGGAGGVAVLERSTVGLLDVSVLAASDADALLGWLNSNGYATSDRIAGVADYYLSRGWCFTAARIDMNKLPKATAEIEKQRLANGEFQPLRLRFRSPNPVYPLRISSLNGGESEVLLYLAIEGGSQPSAPRGFKTEYSDRVAAAQFNGLTRGRPSAAGSVWLVKMVRKMPTSTMTQDLVFAGSMGLTQ